MQSFEIHAVHHKGQRLYSVIRVPPGEVVFGPVSWDEAKADYRRRAGSISLAPGSARVYSTDMDIRKTIVDQLAKTDRSTYWLAVEAERHGICQRETVYRYLRGTRDTTTEVAGQILDLLQIQLVVPGARAVPLSKLPRPKPVPAAVAHSEKKSGRVREAIKAHQRKTAARA